MEELDQDYEIPSDFDAEGFFSNYFGIIVSEEPAEVTLRVEPFQANYFRTLPLHHSQKEAEPVDGWPVFTYRIAPTFDFIQERLSKGPDVEVLAPQSLRQDIADTAAAMHQLYSEK